MVTKVLARFKVGSVTDHGNDNHDVNLSPVTSGKGNESFSKWTPSGKMEMHITNPGCIGFFKPGKEYNIEFTEVVETE